ncbi:TIGR04255 family protein [Embleya sp. NPDC005971]|uniref:TIGR04255 family protein n=1 Tax=Embleya sp. NPDC005971 TaxID=3156724 RepID=UPI0033D16A22
MDKSPVPRPLVFVAAEVRTAYTPALIDDAMIAAITTSVPSLVVPHREQRTTFTWGAEKLPGQSQETALRLMDKASGFSLMLTTSSVTLETTRYPGIDVFSQIFQKCIEVASEVARPAIVERVGLRYVNELRSPSPIERILDWREVVNSDALCMVAGAEVALRGTGLPEDAVTDTAGYQSVYAAKLSGNRAVTMRLVALESGSVIGPTPLRRESPASNDPLFVVDLDGFWPREHGDANDFDPQALVKTLLSLHAPIEDLFLWATTDHFRSVAL